jgi:hypothetical protein
MSPFDVNMALDAGYDAGRPRVPRRPTVTSCGFGAPTALATVSHASIQEISGVVASRRNPGIVWMMNDSGGAATVYAVNLSGRVVAAYDVGGVAIDYEDLAIGSGPDPGQDYLYVGDIGDNTSVRANIVIYRAVEPTVTPDQAFISDSFAAWILLPATYPAGMKDTAEMLFDPISRISSSRAQRLRPNRSSARGAARCGVTREMELVGETYGGNSLTDNALTGGDISADGLQIITRSLNAANYWVRDPAMTVAETFMMIPCDAVLPTEPKGEAIGFSAAGDGYYTISEGLSQPLYFVAE